MEAGLEGLTVYVFTVLSHTLDVNKVLITNYMYM